MTCIDARVDRCRRSAGPQAEDAELLTGSHPAPAEGHYAKLSDRDQSQGPVISLENLPVAKLWH